MLTDRWLRDIGLWHSVPVAQCQQNHPVDFWLSWWLRIFLRYKFMNTDRGYCDDLVTLTVSYAMSIAFVTPRLQVSIKFEVNKMCSLNHWVTLWHWPWRLRFASTNDRLVTRVMFGYRMIRMKNRSFDDRISRSFRFRVRLYIPRES